jgi:hypothetical protein
MQLKRAIWIAVLLYVASFITGFVNAMILGFDMSSMGAVPVAVWVANMLVGALLCAVFAWWYFLKATAGAREGALLGLIFVGVSFVIEGVFIIPAMIVSGVAGDLLAYYGHPLFWVAVALVIGAACAVGWWKGRAGAQNL